MDIKGIEAIGEEALLAGAGRGRGIPLKDFTAAGRDLSSYRRTALPTPLPRRVEQGVEQGRGVARGVGGDVGRDIGKGFGEALFRSKAGSNSGSNSGSGVRGVEGGFVRGVGGGGGGIGVGQRAAALRRTGGILSQRFLESNLLLSPAPVSLPSLESLGVGGGVVGLPNGDIGGGGLSADVLRALQKYRVAAEVQG